ncbi:MAG: T9SS type A sorting domain-containing protein [Elusimicrobiota bacterium]
MSVRLPDGQQASVPIGPDHLVSAGAITFNDKGTLDTHSPAMIDWGDGTVEPVYPPELSESPFGPPGSVDGADGAVSRLHQYKSNGHFTMTATITDDDGAATSDSLVITADVEPPVTAIAHSGSSSTVTGTPADIDVFLDAGAMNSLSAVDPDAAGITFDVQWTFYRDLTIDGAEALFIRQNVEHEVVPFNLSQEGPHQLEYFSVDKRGNEEGYRLGPVQEGHKHILVGVDQTAPVSELHVAEPVRYQFGQTFIGTETELSLTAEDPLAPAVGGVASGVKEIQYRIDGGEKVLYLTPFTLEEGVHTVTYWSVDQVNNTEDERPVEFNVGSVMNVSQTAGVGKTGEVVFGGTVDFLGNLTANGPVSFDGTTLLDGDVTAPTVEKNSNSTITGTITETGEESPLDPAPFDLAAVREYARQHNLAEDPENPIAEYINKKGELESTGGILTLPAGTYLVKGLKLSGGAALRVSGEVGLLVEGEISINSANVNTGAERPGDLMIFVNRPAKIDLKSNARMAAILYAPDATMTFGGGSQFGGRLFTGYMGMNGNAIVLSNEAPETYGGEEEGGATPASAAANLSPEGADPTFTLRDVYVFPNPAVGGAKPTVHIAVGIADKVTIRIYDIAGQQVHQATVDGVPPVINDGTGPKYAYEYAWEGRIPSGVYLYTIVAEKSGEASIRKAGKFAVVR